MKWFDVTALVAMEIRDEKPLNHFSAYEPPPICVCEMCICVCCVVCITVSNCFGYKVVKWFFILHSLIVFGVTSNHFGNHFGFQCG